MSISTQFDVKYDPLYNYHRNTQLIEKGYSDKSSWVNTAKRVAYASLTFLSMYPLLKFPISVGKSAWRSMNSVTQLFGTIQSKKTNKISQQLLRTTISVIGFVSLIFAFSVGFLITTTYFLIMGVVSLIENLAKGNFEKALRSLGGVIKNSLSLALTFYGGWAVAFALLSIKLLLTVDKTNQELQKENYIEAMENLLVSTLQGGQLVNKANTIPKKQ